MAGGTGDLNIFLERVNILMYLKSAPKAESNRENPKRAKESEREFLKKTVQ